MTAPDVFARYQALQRYVGWTDEDADRIRTAAPVLEPALPGLIEDFYQEARRHPAANRVITGGAAQVERLKGTLLTWLGELLGGRYDERYVAGRWRVGWRHVEIGLDQVYTNVALSRLRRGLLEALSTRWPGDPAGISPVARSLNTLLDLDLALIEDAYQQEYLARQQRTERLAAIGQVAGGVAHELRNPLNVVKTSVYYLLNARNATNEKKAEHLARIERQVLLADGVITALSNFARLPIPAAIPFAVADLVRESLEANPTTDSVRVLLDFPASLPPALADPEQIRIVFGNLIRNAREAMPEGGQLALRGRPTEGRHGPAVEVTVNDTGTGIAPEHLAHILEPLYSTKARGLGLGLAITRSILDKNGGSLSVASQFGHGSTFTVLLPAAQPALGTEPPAEGDDP